MAAEPRLVIIATHPIQYQVPLFRALAADTRIESHVLFLSRHGLDSRLDPGYGVEFAWDIDLLGGYASSFLPNVREHARPGGILSYVNPTVNRALRDLDPDAILFLGVRSATSLAAFAWAVRRGVRRLYRAESSILQRRPARTRASARALLRRADAVLPIGTANDLYYDTLGISDSRRHLAPYTVDNAFFERATVSKTAARETLGLGQDEIILAYVGKLAPWKDPATLVAAAALGDSPVRVLLAGDGMLRAQLERQAASLSVPLTVLGFMNQNEVPFAYAAADVLVLPSLVEPWGLVVNEAMCAALPIVASHRVGSRLDLVTPGVNGAVFRAGDPASLARALGPMVASADVREEYGRASTARIASWDIRDTVQGIAGALACG